MSDINDINDKNMSEEKENCDCCDQCTCGDGCQCNGEHKCSENCTCGEKKCNCTDDCQCGDDCHCDDNCSCGDDCTCGENCSCQEENKCNDECNCQEKEENDKAVEYLNLAKQVQADFENFRRHAVEDIKQARISGQTSVIEVFLPCLDTFKEAKKSITDENVLKGFEMVENSISNSLKSLGVEKIQSVGEKYNPHLHNAIAVMKDEEKENDVILEEYQAGYKFHDKVIRYAIVSVNKKED